MSVGVPAVSLIMAAHAPRTEWLREAVSSALAQRDCSFELVIVDDGSPTPVEESLGGLEGDRLRVMRTEHRGVSDARNAGIEASRGNYLRFIDADDYFPPESTSLLLGLIDGSDRGIAVGATRWCREDLEPIFDWPAGCRGDAVRSCLLLRSTPTIPSMLLPRSVVDSAGPWDPEFRVCEDWDFIMRALEHGQAVETKHVVSWYRQHEPSASGDRAEAWRGTLLGVERYFSRHPENHALLDRKVNSMLDLTAAELQRPGHPWRSRRFWRALGRDPTALRAVYVRQIRSKFARLRTRVTESR
jgi:glycosyltransferase involved in cell wall biosynthesis